MKHCKYFFFVYAIVILSSVGANAATVTGLATPDYVKGAINSLPAVARSGSYNDLSNKPTIPAAQVNSDWNATSGKAQILNKPTLGALASQAKVTNTYIDDGAIAVSKISGAQTTGNLVDTTDKIEANKTSTSKYPSMAVAQQIAANAATAAVASLPKDVKDLQSQVDELTATVEENKGAAEEAISGLTGTQTGSGVVKSVTQANGKVTSTRGLVTTAEITDLNVTTGKLAADAVTNAKLADNAVQSENIKDGEVKTADIANSAVTAVKTSGVIGKIPSGSATATTYADIWVQ